MPSGKSLEEHNAFASFWLEGVARGLTVRQIANDLGITERGAYMSRDSCQRALGIALPVSRNASRDLFPQLDHITIEAPEVRLLIGSDWHIWPGYYSRAEEAFFKVLASETFDIILLNGDVTDQPQVSRHGPSAGIPVPRLQDEIAEAQVRVAEVARLARKRNRDCRLIWIFGNHDVRMWRYIANNAPEVGEMLTFEDRFPQWEFSTSLDINNVVMIKHRWHGGLHAAYNNALRAGMTLVTGDTHRLSCLRWTDYIGVRYGIETGMLGDPRGPQFQYADNNPVNWCPGFAELLVTDEVHCDLIDCSRRIIRRRGKVLCE
jgi:predicted phosphodiesterase